MTQTNSRVPSVVEPLCSTSGDAIFTPAILPTRIPLARAVPQGRVVAFEPQRVVEQILSANVQLNALPNVDVRRAVLGPLSRPLRAISPHQYLHLLAAAAALLCASMCGIEGLVMCEPGMLIQRLFAQAQTAARAQCTCQT